MRGEVWAGQRCQLCLRHCKPAMGVEKAVGDGGCGGLGVGGVVMESRCSEVLKFEELAWYKASECTG